MQRPSSRRIVLLLAACLVGTALVGLAPGASAYDPVCEQTGWCSCEGGHPCDWNHYHVAGFCLMAPDPDCQDSYLNKIPFYDPEDP